MAVKKILVSFFIVFNITTILFINRPNFFIKTVNEIIDSLKAPQFAYQLRLYSWYIARYAHLVGLDNRWQMFGRQSRFNWWYTIKAKYENSEEVILPLSRQSKRTFLQWLLFDFKEAKLHLNIYNNVIGRETYARYLCRKYPINNNSQVKSITYDLNYQKIYMPKEARLYMTHTDPNVYMIFLNEFICPAGEHTP